MSTSNIMDKKMILECNLPRSEIEKGYTNQTLYINLSTNRCKVKPVSKIMKEKFIGGKGFDLWLMWNSLPKDKVVKWNDPENEICIATGPLGSSPIIPGSGKSIVTTISPLTGMIVDSNVGGYFGAYLKYAGFDAMEIQGKAKEPVIIVIDGIEHKLTILHASDSEIELSKNSHELTQKLTEQFSDSKKKIQKSQISIVSSGIGAKHSYWGILNFSWYSKHRNWASYKQAGRGGIGTVFSDKNIIALVAISPNKIPSINPADPERMRKIAKEHSKELILNDPKQNEMRAVGTGHLPEIMNEFDIIPTENFRFGMHHSLKSEDIPYHREFWRKHFDSPGKGHASCWIGCPLSCSHFVKSHKVLTGPYKDQIVSVDGPEYETIAGCGSNWGIWDLKWVLEANFYCDTYGLDTISVGTGIAFVMECYEEGLITKEHTGGLDLKFGNPYAAFDLLHQIANGEGFGKIVGKGIRYMKKYFEENFGIDFQFLQDIGMEHKGLEFSEYVTKESLTQQGGYGLALKGPQHDEAWLIFEDVVRKSIPTFQDKAKALRWFPYWRTWFGLNGLCKLPWNDVQPPDNGENPLHDPETGELYRARIPKHVEWYAEYYSAVTGKESTPDDLIRDSERVYTFQRIFNIRQGKGLKEHDSNLPYRAMGPVTELEYNSRKERYDNQLKTEVGVDIEGLSVKEKIKLLRDYKIEQYEKLQLQVYKERKWTENGVPSLNLIKELGLDLDGIVEIIKTRQ